MPFRLLLSGEIDCSEIGADTEIWRNAARFAIFSSGLVRIIERLYFFDLAVYDLNLIEDMIHAVQRVHIEDRCNIISLNNVLLYVNAPDHR